MLFEEYVDLSVYRALLESSASEHGARMTAMRSAAENAQDMIGDLTLEMNRVRQAEITQEILEVVAGAEAGRMARSLNRRRQMADSNGDGTNKGRIEQVTGVVVDVVFPEQLPEIYSALEIEMDAGAAATATRRGRSSARSSSTSATTGCERWPDGRDRQPAAARPEVIDTGGPITFSWATRRWAGSSTCSATRSTTPGRSRGHPLADPSPGPRRRGPDSVAGDPRDRDQGRRPARPTRRAARSASSAAPASARRS